jgi:hypothetical protein
MTGTTQPKKRKAPASRSVETKISARRRAELDLLQTHGVRVCDCITSDREAFSYFLKRQDYWRKQYGVVEER